MYIYYVALNEQSVSLEQYLLCVDVPWQYIVW